MEYLTWCGAGLGMGRELSTLRTSGPPNSCTITPFIVSLSRSMPKFFARLDRWIIPHLRSSWRCSTRPTLRDKAVVDRTEDGSRAPRARNFPRTNEEGQCVSLGPMQIAWGTSPHVHRREHPSARTTCDGGNSRAGSQQCLTHGLYFLPMSRPHGVCIIAWARPSLAFWSRFFLFLTAEALVARLAMCDPLSS